MHCTEKSVYVFDLVEFKVYYSKQQNISSREDDSHGETYITIIANYVTSTKFFSEQFII